MPHFKSQALLQNASVAVSAGARPASQRNVMKALGASTVLLAALAFGGQAHAQNHAASFEGQSDQQVLSVQPQQLVGEVVSVRHVADTSRRTHRGQISPRSIAGALLGGVVGHQFGGGDGKKVSTLFGALAGGSIANRLADRRAGVGHQTYQNARQVEDNDMVTVRVSNGGGFQTYEIVQPAGFGLNRGDSVALVTSKDGQTLMALPIAYEPAPEQNDRYSPRRPRR